MVYTWAMTIAKNEGVFFVVTWKLLFCGGRIKLWCSNLLIPSSMETLGEICPGGDEYTYPYPLVGKTLEGGIDQQGYSDIFQIY